MSSTIIHFQITRTEVFLWSWLSHELDGPFVGLVFDMCPFQSVPFVVALNLGKEDQIKSESEAK